MYYVGRNRLVVHRDMIQRSAAHRRSPNRSALKVKTERDGRTRRDDTGSDSLVARSNEVVVDIDVDIDGQVFGVCLKISKNGTQRTVRKGAVSSGAHSQLGTTRGRKMSTGCHLDQRVEYVLLAQSVDCRE